MLYSSKLNVYGAPKAVLYRISGAIIAVIATGLAGPMVLSIIDNHKDFDNYFFIILALVGLSIFLFHRSHNYQEFHLKARHVFLLTLLSWLLACSCACLPFLFCEPHLSLVNAWFESVSAVTTTGSTEYRQNKRHLS